MNWCALAAFIIATQPSAVASRIGPYLGAALSVRQKDLAQVVIRVDKEHRKLLLLLRGRTLKQYPIVLGSNPVDDKLCEGDGCTPEGVFKITEIRSPHRWKRFLLLNYPTANSRARFANAIRTGKLPKTASIGGAIGIHGVPKGFDRAIDRGQNWTAGCISLKTDDIVEITRLCRKGTRVTIVH